ncbi:hypothetical protein [Thermicanus aegyptius]|uniref:hypothetical protein n=1 Tax=Thermicanus aegyptius TaxID=94009 RepID=UPI001B7F868A|nr:hypothetical protein [Thermicanus aegyptius]
MHKSIVIAVSVLLFVLFAVVAVVITDLHDRFFPVQLGVQSKVSLDFSDAGMSDEEAFRLPLLLGSSSSPDWRRPRGY